MKNTTILAVCFCLLLGGLLGLHLVAQPGGTGSRATESAPAFSLLAPNVSERSEKELLEQKVVAHQGIVAQIEAHAQMGTPRGTAIRLAEVHANLATAEIELYRYTGEQDKLLAALKARVEHLTDKLRATTNAFENSTTDMESVHEAKLQLLDALLEQKRVHASLNTP